MAWNVDTESLTVFYRHHRETEISRCGVARITEDSLREEIKLFTGFLSHVRVIGCQTRVSFALRLLQVVRLSTVGDSGTGPSEFSVRCALERRRAWTKLSPWKHNTQRHSIDHVAKFDEGSTRREVGINIHTRFSIRTGARERSVMFCAKFSASEHLRTLRSAVLETHLRHS